MIHHKAVLSRQTVNELPHCLTTPSAPPNDQRLHAPDPYVENQLSANFPNYKLDHTKICSKAATHQVTLIQFSIIHQLHRLPPLRRLPHSSSLGALMFTSSSNEGFHYHFHESQFIKKRSSDLMPIVKKIHTIENADTRKDAYDK